MTRVMNGDRFRASSESLQKQIDHLIDEKARQLRIARWMDGWSFREETQQWLHVDGHRLSAEIVEIHIGDWAFLSMWHRLQGAA